jgi:Leucine-rich repeat (LRR) protein
MDEAENRAIRDPSADTCFLGGSIDERPDPEIANEVPNELSLAMQNDNVSNQLKIPPSEDVDSTGAAPGVTRLKNPFNTDPALPSGEEIDSKNTLQSFHTRIPVDRGNDCDDLMVVASTLPPSDIHVASNHPKLPSGEIIDSKNTLQCFNTRAAVPFRDIGPSDANNMNITDSDGMPTAAAWIPPSQTSDREAPPAETVYVAELVPSSTTRRKTTLVWVLFGVFALLGASLIAGVCFSGNCGSSDSSQNLSPTEQRPAFSPTVFPTAIPAVSPIEVVVSEFVNNISYLQEEISVNGTSAESRALAWIIHDDPLFAPSALLTLSMQTDDVVCLRVRQRYTLAIFWFQQLNPEGLFVKPWNKTLGWLEENECEWFGIVCDANGYVNQIQFYDYTDIDSVGNSFVGSIPPDIGLLTSLSGLSLRTFKTGGDMMSENDTGMIPNAVLSKIPNIVTGTIPESIGQCSKISIFDIAYGSVSGTLPSSMGRWTDMFSFDVSANDIIGSIPESVSSWTNIVGFSVFGNQLTGSIPPFVVQWSQLQYFAVFDNELTSTIPEDIGNLNDLTIFAISLNRLTGTLPSSIGKLTALTGFVVQDNRLSGTIPSSIGNWSQIERAYFATNRLTGTMPQEICANIQEGDVLWSDCEVNCTCCTLACLS